MCDKELVVAYLYDDLSAAERAAFESHQRECAECQGEVKALRAVRADLAAWTLPESDLGFRVVRGASDTGHVLRMPAPTWRAWWRPAAGFAAAAVLVLAAAASLAHVEVHRGPDGVTVRTGWASSPAPAVAEATAARRDSGTAPKVQLAAASPADTALLAELDRRLRALESSTPHSGVRNASAVTARASDDDLVKRMRELLAQSETRQQGQLALRIAQVLHDVEAQRIADLTMIQQGLRGVEASVTAEAVGHRELTRYILASATQTQK